MTDDIPTEATAVIGERMRQLRKRRGLTLNQLAAASSLSTGYLSLIERNLSAPSISAMVAISKALGVVVTWFFAGEEAAQPDQEIGYVIRAKDRLKVHYDQGITDELLTPKMSMQVEMLRSIFPPGSGSTKAYSHDGDEVGLVLSGELELWVGTRHFHLKAGDSFSYSSREEHRYRNPSDTETVVIWAISPPGY